MIEQISSLKLNPRQEEILAFLARHPGRKFSAKDIAAGIDWAIWEDMPPPSQKCVISHIWLLKKQCRRAGFDVLLKPWGSRHGHGYEYRGLSRIRRRA